MQLRFCMTWLSGKYSHTTQDGSSDYACDLYSEVHSSVLGWDTDYPARALLALLSLPQGKFQGSTLHYVTAVSFHNMSISQSGYMMSYW
jgi:hypothetical protein